MTVLRHPKEFSAANTATSYGVNKPLLNAGDGKNEHPTQALLDLFTILETGQLMQTSDKPFVIALCGDLKYGRTVHSLVKILKKLDLSRSIQIYLVSPASLQLPEYLMNTFPNMEKVNTYDLPIGTVLILFSDSKVASRIHWSCISTSYYLSPLPARQVLHKYIGGLSLALCPQWANTHNHKSHLLTNITN